MKRKFGYKKGKGKSYGGKRGVSRKKFGYAKRIKSYGSSRGGIRL